VTKKTVTDLTAVFLAEKVLPRIKNLKSFICDLSRTKVTGKSLKAFAQANLASQKNLETFRFNVTQATFKQEEVSQFLSVIPNVKDLLLGFGETNLTDQGLEAFSTNVLPYLNRLERFELGFQYSKVTDVGIQKVLVNLPSNITNLLIGMNSLKITDVSMEGFLNERLPSLKKLQELRFGLTETKLSKDVKNQISQWREKVVRDNDIQKEVTPFIQPQGESSAQ